MMVVARSTQSNRRIWRCVWPWCPRSKMGLPPCLQEPSSSSAVWFWSRLSSRSWLACGGGGRRSLRKHGHHRSSSPRRSRTQPRTLCPPQWRRFRQAPPPRVSHTRQRSAGGRATSWPIRRKVRRHPRQLGPACRRRISADTHAAPWRIPRASPRQPPLSRRLRPARCPRGRRRGTAWRRRRCRPPRGPWIERSAGGIQRGVVSVRLAPVRAVAPNPDTELLGEKTFKVCISLGALHDSAHRRMTSAFSAELS